MTEQHNIFREPITILEGDCRELLKAVPSNSVDLIFTSPPYSDARKKSYGGVPPEKYVDWFLPISAEFFRVLKPTATWILNIKEKVVKGERSCYVIDLIKALREQGFLYTEEYIWHKKNAMPGKWKNRFRDAWERLLQFNKTKNFNMYQNAVMVRRQDSTAKRSENLHPKWQKRVQSTTGSPFGRNYSAWTDREYVYPSNIFVSAVESQNRHHSAVFPESLPEWFIKLFTVEGDTVLDSFAGSGTVGAVCRRFNRRFIGMELQPEYAALAKERILAAEVPISKTSKHRKEKTNAVPLLPLFLSQSDDSR